MLKGKVISFNDIIGEGYIEPDKKSGKIYFSYKEIQKNGYKIIDEGQKVLYNICHRKHRKTVAINIIKSKR